MKLTMTRRAALAGGAAALLTPTLARARSAERRFTVLRGGDPIGTHVVRASRSGDTVEAATEIDIAVTFLGITAYRYTLDYRETYRGGQLAAFSGRCNDDGTEESVEVSREGNMLRIDGTGYSGEAPAQAVPTSYWRRAALQASPWISAQSGELLGIGVREGGANVPAGSTGYTVSDGAGYDVELWYDAAGDWTGCAFDAEGEPGLYRLEPGSASLVELAA